MQAQTIRARRTIRMPWLPLLVAALLIAAIAIGTAVTMSRGGDTKGPATTELFIPSDLSPGFVPTGKVPDRVHQGVSNAAREDTDPVFVAPNGKPLP